MQVFRRSRVRSPHTTELFLPFHLFLFFCSTAALPSLQLFLYSSPPLFISPAMLPPSSIFLLPIFFYLSLLLISI
ncbi:hypothetical protein GGR53DRAFT_474400 [Hypoxylon sp. FL1150]|nr:hypothetical protein GGR53DRAFT_474400 [Hypoxylon sp. FL1150]